jgi:hypothetical protein
MPQGQSLNIIGKFWMKKIVSALEECEKLKTTSLVRSDCKHIFGDYMNDHGSESLSLNID